MSNKINDSGPAFPGWTQDAAYEQGMTLRDYFAIHATEDDLRTWTGRGMSRSDARYAFADDMLETRGWQP